MRFVSYLEEGSPRPGVLEGDWVRPIRAASLIEYIAGPRREAAGLGQPLALADLTLDAPVRPHKNVVGVGRNYMDHAREIANATGISLSLPEVPTFFTKAPTAIAAPGRVLRLSADVSAQYDWEAELAVVIGTRCRDVPAERAYEVVFGYTCLNDLTARDLQKAHRQYFKGKSLDDTCPLGPWIVSPDEVGDPANLDIALRVDGVTKQRSNTREMIFKIPALIESLSRGMTLEPGDVIATGTPDGVGTARTPPEFLANGNVVEVEIERIGVLRNTIAFFSGSAA